MKISKQLINNNYQIEIKDIIPQTGGWASLAFKLISQSNKIYFLKVYEKKRASIAKWITLIDIYIPVVIWLNKTTELKNKIISPIQLINGGYKCEDADYIYLLFDYIDGETIGEKTLNPQQVRQLAESIALLHNIRQSDIDTIINPLVKQQITETFQTQFVGSLLEFINSKTQANNLLINNLIKQFNNPLLTLIEQFNQLTQKVIASTPANVLCHTDLHHWNMMQTSEQLILLDWEGLKFAPPEADFFGLIDKPYFGQFLQIYHQYRPTFKISQTALHYYLIRRKLEDICELIEQYLYDPLPETEKVNVLKLLQQELVTING